jgi:hypothetical protein
MIETAERITIIDNLVIENCSHRSDPSVRGCKELWVVQLGGDDIGVLRGSPQYDLEGERSDVPWNWHANAYHGLKPSGWRRHIFVDTVHSKEEAAQLVLNYHEKHGGTNLIPPR